MTGFLAHKAKELDQVGVYGEITEMVLSESKHSFQKTRSTWLPWLQSRMHSLNCSGPWEAARFPPPTTRA